MATKTVGFAIDERDRDRLERLVTKYGHGNRSAFLRVAIEYMEADERAERLRRLQAYGAERAAAAEVSLEDVNDVVHRVLAKKRSSRSNKR